MKAIEKEKEEEKRYANREFSYQSFSRTITMQKDVVDSDNIQARYEKGELHLLIPKRNRPNKQPRSIEIL